MIVFELQCPDLHRFEGWFASTEDYERQLAAGQIACPVCAASGVRKVPSARIKRPRELPAQPQPDKKQVPAAAAAAPATAKLAPAQQMTLAAFIDHVLVSSEDVGTRFAEEARKIHQGEAPRRSIRGQATAAETEALLEEGVPVMPLPIPPKDEWQ